MTNVPAYILGQAQHSYHEVDAVTHPLELMQQIALKALADAGVSAAEVNGIGCVDPFSWTYADLGQQVARGIGCADDIRDFWLPAGGTTPQDLIHEIAIAMSNKELDVAVVVGAEAMRTRRKASRANIELPWPARDKSVSPMRGQQPFTSDWEARHGLRLPIQSFPLHENALRTANQRSAEQQIMLAATLLHENALVAATNPHAWFQDAPSVELISTVTDENRMIAYPYTKRMNAIMDVDQAAALVIVSERYISAHPQSREQAVAILGGAGAEEVWNPTQRQSFSDCVAMEVAFSQALSDAGLDTADIDAFDFYSCFPSPVQMALAALGLTPDDARPFTLTGGLAYAGGPGNNYVSHSLATATARLRQHPEQRLMVTGVGMANTKHAATLLSHANHVPPDASGATAYRIPTGAEALPMAERAQGRSKIVTYTIEYDREGSPTNVIFVLDLDGGQRAIANARDAEKTAARLSTADPIGQTGDLVWDEIAERQFFTLD